MRNVSGPSSKAAETMLPNMAEAKPSNPTRNNLESRASASRPPNHSVPCLHTCVRLQPEASSLFPLPQPPAIRAPQNPGARHSRAGALSLFADYRPEQSHQRLWADLSAAQRDRESHNAVDLQ